MILHREPVKMKIAHVRSGGLAATLLGAIMVLASPSAAQAQEAVEYLDPPPGMPFSAATRVGDILYLSGEIGTLPDGSLPEGMEAQTRQTMDNLARTMARYGVGFEDVFKCLVMLTDMSKWADFNAIYIEYFEPDRLPARSALGANGLALGALVEVECWAYAPKDGE